MSTFQYVCVVALGVGALVGFTYLGLVVRAQGKVPQPIHWATAGMFMASISIMLVFGAFIASWFI